MQISDLKRGDLLLLKDTPDNTSTKHKGIRVGQWLTGMNRKRKNEGSSRLVHALIWTGNGLAAEASGKAGRLRLVKLSEGFFKIFRCTDQQLANRAGEAASRWASGDQIDYAKRKAVTSILHSDDMGKHGAARARVYASHINSDQGVFGKNVRGQELAFCSEFVIACYQAAALDLNPQTNLKRSYILGCDAKHCSVRALHDRLVRDSAMFNYEGDIDATFNRFDLLLP